MICDVCRVVKSSSYVNRRTRSLVVWLNSCYGQAYWLVTGHKVAILQSWNEEGEKKEGRDFVRIERQLNSNYWVVTGKRDSGN